MTGALWLLIRWMADVVVTGDIDNQWFSEMPPKIISFMSDVGTDIIALFS